MVFGREREGGKDSHSRQWRLSMAVFLNRNQRPQAAPIEGAGASGTEAASLAILSLRRPYALWRAGGVAAGVALGEKTGG